MKKMEGDLKAYLGVDSVFQGALNFTGVVRIDGKFEGEVMTNDTLIIGETGEIIAEIAAGTVICKGKIKGSIQAAKRVETHSKSQVVGNIRSPSLYVEVGALFDGNCDMASKDDKIIKLVKTEDQEGGAKKG